MSLRLRPASRDPLTRLASLATLSPKVARVAR